MEALFLLPTLILYGILFLVASKDGKKLLTFEAKTCYIIIVAVTETKKRSKKNC